ncbi:MAG TPA: hypothetical protein VLH60_04290 [Sedimentisphaerales bacterium]|nr:hypothetical protein [Sedimentisphaerales bacterium]
MPAKPDSRMRKGSAMAAVAAVIIVIVMMMFLSKLAASRAAVASARQKADRAATSARSGAELLLYIFQQIADSNQLPAGYDQA